MTDLEEFDNSKDIETRKVQKLGSSSLFITLPKKWINRWNIKPGDKILIEISDDGSLKLLAEKIKLLSNRKTIKIDIDAIKQPIPSMVLCLYSLGYDEIVFESKKQIVQKEIEDLISTTKQMVGAEVTEASENRVKLECLLDAEKVGLESLLRRILNIISKKVDGIISYLSGEQPKDSELTQQEDLRRVYLMLLRHVVGSKYEVSSNLNKNFLVVMNAVILLNISRLIDRIDSTIKTTKLNEDTPILKEILQKINDLLDEVIMSILFPSMKRVSNGLNLINQINSLLQSFNDKSSIIYTSVVDIVSNLQLALENSSCTLFLEDMPWIERNFNVVK
ncbi:AbrB/MazE/SpoVT family DNA-binding domain-containing protein [Acidianus ambivalens]|uniref:AbrB/MazE/SpoVT family DNA-binding domain-containing protein n=1 Tax=Acidianus ambivalens TaxID=2283 RepID=A0A650CSQ3_ACIAM|nr:AbrB/MazE/SpoVT family DNA-binding domain-containing protein [Acidianus ambivalens]MQL55307.1 AbrB/MazE/SpoVT family DNA-binding domain-containing protein [Acidianus ambivalens]QGR20849.1 AbrB/MazE/SpoVT family DNA-binding domain-containing protein [Acidianus ambivalens]